MSKLFTNGLPSQHNTYEQKYMTSRGSLLLVVIFTIINLLLLVANTDSYFLFSAYIPYFIASIGMYSCGRFPAEYYTDLPEDEIFLDGSFLAAFLLIAIALTLLYLLAWFMSAKKRVGWLIFSLVFFSLDTLALLSVFGISLDGIFDVLFHAWVIYDLAMGIKAHYKLKKIPPEELIVSSTDSEDSATNIQKASDSYVIRKANKDIKHRVLLEKRVLDYDVCYRRVKHTNELVINGNVYDEIEGIIECPHVLKAWIDGHYISAGNDGFYSFISVDNEKAAKKIRWF